MQEHTCQGHPIHVLIKRNDKLPAAVSHPVPLLVICVKEEFHFAANANKDDRAVFAMRCVASSLLGPLSTA